MQFIQKSVTCFDAIGQNWDANVQLDLMIEQFVVSLNVYNINYVVSIIHFYALNNYYLCTVYYYTLIHLCSI